MRNIKDVFTSVSDRWFLREPFLFSVFCTHRLVENNSMDCCIRSGKMRIEYNSKKLAVYSNNEIAELIKREVLRIILKHPYQRQPQNPIPEMVYLASNLCLYFNGGTNIKPSEQVQLSGYDISIHPKLSFEEWYKILLKLQSSEKSNQLQQGDEKKKSNKSDTNDQSSSGTNSNKQSDESSESSSSDQPSSGLESDSQSGDYGESSDKGQSSSAAESDSENHPVGKESKSCIQEDIGDDTSDAETDYCKGGAESGESKNTGQKESDRETVSDNGRDATALWDESPLFCEQINQKIENTDLRNWGSVIGHLKEAILASTKKAENLMRRLEMFRTSILSVNQRCTRMRPSRRYGWEQMGKLHPYCSKLLIGVDASASITSANLKKFFSIINSFFSFGFPQIDVLTFDTKIYLPVMSLNHAKNRCEVKGRGGTNFSEIIEFYEKHSEYDGLIIFTDGYAPLPEMPKGRKVLWALRDKPSYDKFQLSPKIHLPE